MSAASGHTVYVLAGPTAVGKTAVAIALAQKLHTSIISADSRQCYKEMNIGTAKPSAEELAAVKHYFINEFSATASLTAADFENLALQYLDEIFAHSNYAVVCGGTGLYIKALCEGLDEMPEVDEQVVYDVNTEYALNGLNWLQQRVRLEDEAFFTTGENRNPARLLRALIFKRSTGTSITNFRKGERKQRNFRVIKIGLELSREELYARINERVDDMMRQGLLDEVKALYPLKDLKNLQTVGYTELFNYLDNEYDLDEAVTKIKQHTRNYAKRQMTWFRKDEEMHWLHADDPQIIEKILAIK